jgi:hypothetical protein
MVCTGFVMLAASGQNHLTLTLRLCISLKRIFNLENKMSVYIYTYCSNQGPKTWYSLEESQINWACPPWEFHGYSRMNAASEEEVQAEFQAMLDAWYESINLE